MCTIHQPSAEVFEILDWILLLQAGGRTCYLGPVAAMPRYLDKHHINICKAPSLAAFLLTKLGIAIPEREEIISMSIRNKRLLSDPNPPRRVKNIKNRVGKCHRKDTTLKQSTLDLGRVTFRRSTQTLNTCARHLGQD
jgi:hypothetical protein